VTLGGCVPERPARLERLGQGRQQTAEKTSLASLTSLSGTHPPKPVLLSKEGCKVAGGIPPGTPVGSQKQVAKTGGAAARRSTAATPDLLLAL
jgi:hypothetical protein